MKSINKQKGVVMIIALIMLLAITILGVSAVNLSRNKTQVAGNTIFTTFTYLGAESTLARSASISSEKHIVDAVANGSPIYSIPAHFINDSNEVVNNGTNMLSTSTIESIAGIYECPPIDNDISSTAFKCRVFEITAKTSITATAAKATHIEARAKMVIK
ncbi:MAG: pilus assembly PilX N-terminal domain-containing protein [Cocleimonas sp.]|nr:pilus assembly PilX N-terminal domain-containing protein [Cocleimonas sp.]